VDPKILERGKVNLVGMTHYGPIGGEGWSEENQIGKLWQRFNKFCETKWVSIENRVINPKLGYEVSIWNEDEFKATGDFCIFVEDVETVVGNLRKKGVPVREEPTPAIRGGKRAYVYDPDGVPIEFVDHW